MKSTRITGFVLASLTLLTLGSSTVRAENPFDYLFFPFQKVDADPAKRYVITQEQGPWMVMATSFRGSGAEKQAHDLILELRKEYKLEAFMHRKSYDFSNKVEGRGIDRYGKPKQMVYNRNVQFDEIAVLVGNFESLQSDDAQELLTRIKTMHPRTLGAEPEAGTAQVYAGLRSIQRKLNLSADKKGPMGRAFIIRNPLMPAEYFTQNSVDPFVERLNSGVDHSLLKNPGKFTVQVATFRGKVVYDIEKNYDAEASVSDSLVKAAENAHKLVVALRKQGIEAYEYHDRHESVVCVGSFNKLGTRQLDGKINLEPRVAAVMKAYGAQRVQIPNSSQFGLRPRTLGGIQFDIQPRPVHVPKKSIGSSYLSRF
ncbi:MAG: hypothetical protein CMJ79_01945 [Planctomycetaceae bacterium]|nr:hypothetical protein [Planctomycetaceae bacterium]|tara:strand:+ start:8146 stop:9255 length:1110 start_codon:yes stop_codon:yes gene_type:complete